LSDEVGKTEDRFFETARFTQPLDPDAMSRAFIPGLGARYNPLTGSVD
jgi:hypothetical protein